MIDQRLLKSDELAVFKLRSLYSRFGYTQYKMSKFEEYDLYAKNKDFLVSDRIITFTDTTGKLLALKPDVTLSIINHLGNDTDGIQKLYYNENVYRVSSESHKFKEIMQTGLECVGNCGIYEICEVTALAIKSLAIIDKSYQLDISHAGLVNAILEENGICGETGKLVKDCIFCKNSGGINNLVNNGMLDERQGKVAQALVKNYKDCQSVKTAISPMKEKTADAFNEFEQICNALSQMGMFNNVSINFSLANNMSYYSGIVFKGYIEGVPTGVLSGGQYDILMKKLKKQASAIGFAVYLDSFERLNLFRNEFDCDIALIKDENSTPYEVFKKVDELSQNGEKVIVLDKINDKIKCRKAIDMQGRELN